MHPISKLPAIDRASGDLNVIIDTPKGSRNKFSWDEERELFEWCDRNVAKDGDPKSCHPEPRRRRGTSQSHATSLRKDQA